MSERPITRVVSPEQVRMILDGRIIGPNQPTLLNGVPVSVLREEETVRVPSVAPAPAPAPRAVVYVTRSTAVALAIVAAAASALLTGGVVALLL